MSVASDVASSPRRPGPHPGRPRIVTTRARRGRLDSLLAAGGADVVHVPLIQTQLLVEPEALVEPAAAASWIAVTSPVGASLIAPIVGACGAARFAAVGRSTAAVLEQAGAHVELIPAVQTAAALAAAFPPPDAGLERVLIVRAEQGLGVLAEGLGRQGFEVQQVAAYRTVPRVPSRREALAASRADVITFASGSAVDSWVDLGLSTPPAVAIGPSTAERAAELGVALAGVASPHSIDGLSAIALDLVR